MFKGSIYWIFRLSWLNHVNFKINFDLYLFYTYVMCAINNLRHQFILCKEQIWFRKIFKDFNGLEFRAVQRYIEY